MKESQQRMALTRALVYYARLSGNNGGDFSLDAYITIKGACGKDHATALDLWAAKECLLMLDVLGEKETLDVLRAVYIEPFSKKPLRAVEKNEISMSILNYAHLNHLDERTVYRRVRRARLLWQSIRERGIA